MRTFAGIRVTRRVLTMAALISLIWMVTLRGGTSLFHVISSIVVTPTYEDWTTSLRRTALLGSSSLVHTFSSTQDEVLYIYQRFLLNSWDARPDRVREHRRELLQTTESITIDEVTLTHQNTNSETLLPLYSPLLDKDSAMYKPQPELLRFLPKKPLNPNGTLFNKCSVVGNGGLLLGSACGKEIDKSDYIFRCNMVPIKKFEVDAGSKSNFTTMNPSVIETRYNFLATETDVEAFIQDLVEFNGQLFIPCLFNKKILDLCTTIILPTIFKGLKSDKLNIGVGNPRHLLGILNNWTPAGIKFMSTGFYLAQTALTMCNEVHLYGFWPFSKTIYPIPRTVNYHFYDDRKRSRSHKFNLEFQVLWQLHMEGILHLHTRDCVYPDTWS